MTIATACRRTLFVVLLSSWGTLTTALTYSDHYCLTAHPIVKPIVQGTDHVTIVAFAAWLVYRSRCVRWDFTVRLIAYSLAFAFGRLCARASHHWSIDSIWSPNYFPGQVRDHWVHLSLVVAILCILIAVLSFVEVGTRRFAATRVYAMPTRTTRIQISDLFRWTVFWAMAFSATHIYVRYLALPPTADHADASIEFVGRQVPLSLRTSLMTVVLLLGWYHSFQWGMLSLGVSIAIAFLGSSVVNLFNGISATAVLNNFDAGILLGFTLALSVAVAILRYTQSDYIPHEADSPTPRDRTMR